MVKKLADEKEKRMKLEAQLCEQNLHFDRKEQLTLVPTTGTSQTTFVKPAEALKTAVKSSLPIFTSQMPNPDRIASIFDLCA